MLTQQINVARLYYTIRLLRYSLTDDDNPYIARFLGFSVYLSNTTNYKDGVLCVEDSQYTRSSIPNLVYISCPYNGRYIIYSNNRTQSSIPDGYSEYAFNELCEVEVYGKIHYRIYTKQMLIFCILKLVGSFCCLQLDMLKIHLCRFVNVLYIVFNKNVSVLIVLFSNEFKGCATPGFNGKRCSSPCPTNCLNGHCNRRGECLGCIRGHQGVRCDKGQSLFVCLFQSLCLSLSPHYLSFCESVFLCQAHSLSVYLSFQLYLSLYTFLCLAVFLSLSVTLSFTVVYYLSLSNSLSLISVSLSPSLCFSTSLSHSLLNICLRDIRYF